MIKTNNFTIKKYLLDKSGQKKLAVVKYLKYLLIVIVIIIFTAVLIWPDLQTMFYNQKGIASYNNKQLTTAKTYFDKAKSTKSNLSYVPTANTAVLEYNNKNYTQAYTAFSVAEKNCTKQNNSATTSEISSKKNTKCATIAYDMGNTLYRTGQSVISSNSTNATTTRNALWMKAIAFYQQDLTINPDDTDAEENIKFILKQLNASTSQKQLTSTSQKNSEDNKKAESKSSDNQSTKTKDNQAKTDTSKNEKKNQTDTKNNNADKNSDQQTGQKNNNQSALSTQQNQQLNDYMKKLDQRSRQLQQYFIQNPEAQKKNNDNNPFNDPFFKDFFAGTPLAKQFSNNSPKSLDKDW